MESQPQNPEVSNNPENFHTCSCMYYDYSNIIYAELKIREPFHFEVFLFYTYKI